MTSERPAAITDAPELRSATAQDRDLLFDWRNRPEIVALSSSRRTVTPDEHESWFAAALADPDRWLYIVQVADQPVGHVRVEADADRRATVTIYLIPGWTGRGLGVPVLQELSRLAFGHGYAELRAYVRADNDRSLATFTRAGYRPLPAGDASVPTDHIGLVLTPGAP